MDVGVIGWWHHDNQGDLRILENTTRALAPHRVVPIDSSFRINSDVLERLNRLDFLILGGGGLFQDLPSRPFDTFDVWGRELCTPIGVAGLGVDVVIPKYQAAVHALVGQSRFFYVRDQASQQAVGHPKVQIAPDLTFLYPVKNEASDQTTLANPALCGVNLRKAAGLEIAEWVKTIQELPLNLRGIPFSSTGRWREVEILRQLDAGCASEFNVSLYNDLDLLIGTAFHSVVFSIQAAVPVIAINYSPKVSRLMADIGLEEFVLQPDEWHKLPNLVAQLLDEREVLVSRLRQVTSSLQRVANQTLTSIKAEIKECGRAQSRSDPKVSVLVIGNRSSSATQTTVKSCQDQNYQNVEIILSTELAGQSFQPHPASHPLTVVASAPSQTLGERLNQAWEHATGDYCTWMVAGDFFAHDALDCMASWLQVEPNWEMVFADHYIVDFQGRLSQSNSVYPAGKLVRRDVVGPCFLFRRRLVDSVGRFRDDTPLVAYDYWLRAYRDHQLQPVHARLFYRRVSRCVVEKQSRLERQVRRQWRSREPWLPRLVWRVLDTQLVEAYIIRPLLAAFRRAKQTLDRLRSRQTRTALYED